MTLTTAPGRVSVLGWVFATTGVVLGVVKLVSVVLAPAPFRVLAFNSDDVHYYVLTALHAAQGDGSTFDGLTPTNGYQPLWFLLLTAVFRVVGVDRSGAYVATIAVLVVLWLVAIALLYRLGRDVLGTVGAVAGLVGFLVHARWWTGCENALVVVLLLGVVLLLLSRPVLVGAPRTRTVAWLGVLLAVLVLARLDTTVLVGLLAGAGLWRWRARRGLLLVVVAGPATATLGAYPGQSAVVRHPRPRQRAGQAARTEGLELVGAAGFPALRPARAVAAHFRDHRGRRRDGSAGAVRRSGLPTPLQERAPAVRDVLAILLLAQLGQLVYYAVMSSWELQGWYFSFGVVALVLALGVIGARLSSLRGVRPAVVGAAAAVLLVVTAHEATALDPGAPDDSPYAADIAAGQWADAALPPGSVLAMGDSAGSLRVHAPSRHPARGPRGLAVLSSCTAARHGTGVARGSWSHALRAVDPPRRDRGMRDHRALLRSRAPDDFRRL